MGIAKLGLYQMKIWLNLVPNWTVNWNVKMKKKEWIRECPSFDAQLEKIDFFDFVEHGCPHLFEPTTFKEALANEDANKWKLVILHFPMLKLNTSQVIWL